MNLISSVSTAVLGGGERGERGRGGERGERGRGGERGERGRGGERGERGRGGEREGGGYNRADTSPLCKTGHLC